MYMNHYHDQGASSLTPRTSIDGDMPGMVRSGKKKSIFLDTKPSLDKRPSYGFIAQNKVGQGSDLHPGSKQAFVQDDCEEVGILSILFFRQTDSDGGSHFLSTRRMSFTSPRCPFSVFCAPWECFRWQGTRPDWPNSNTCLAHLDIRSPYSFCSW